jgi:hypothetical protein
MLIRSLEFDPATTNSSVLAMMLREMQSRGLTKLEPDEDRRPTKDRGLPGDLGVSVTGQ